jgi:tRNA U38,U39,U40 pseudouridine synthase TruA
MLWGVNFIHFLLLLARKVDEFDVSRMKAAAAVFPGTRDFRTFMGSKSQSPPDINTIKEMYRLDVTPGTPLLGAECSSSSYYTFWNITCQAKSFLYRQVMCFFNI